LWLPAKWGLTILYLYRGPDKKLKI
jgi:hypothetical protein